MMDYTLHFMIDELFYFSRKKRMTTKAKFPPFGKFATIPDNVTTNEQILN